MKEYLSQWLSNTAIVAKVALVVAVPTALLLFHVWNQYRITEVGYQIAEVTTEHRNLLEENKRLTVEARIQGRSDRVSTVARQQFNLREAHPDQIITIAPVAHDDSDEQDMLEHQSLAGLSPGLP